ncbi:MAG: membrane integrity-associated transporter subunit PqiC [Planctomycetes bacterium]|nr:membrane integrity-associated transporter subunit PqiC [Planctomycetota bacterium]
MNLRHAPVLARAAARAAALALAAGCASTPPETHLYSLDLPPAEGTPGEALVARLGVEEFTASPLLEGRGLVYRLSEVELARYRYHEWAEAPAVLVHGNVAEALRAAGVAGSVLEAPRFYEGEADLVLAGRLVRLEEVDGDKAWRAELELRVELLRPGDRRVVWAETYRDGRIAERRRPEAVVRALAESLREMAARLALDLRVALAEAARAEGGGAEAVPATPR